SPTSGRAWRCSFLRVCRFSVYRLVGYDRSQADMPGGAKGLKSRLEPDPILGWTRPRYGGEPLVTCGGAERRHGGGGVRGGAGARRLCDNTRQRSYPSLPCPYQVLAPGEEEWMPLGPGTGRRGRIMGVRRWPIWGLAPGLRTYILVVLLAYLLAIGLAARVGL